MEKSRGGAGQIRHKKRHGSVDIQDRAGKVRKRLRRADGGVPFPQGYNNVQIQGPYKERAVGDSGL